MTGFAKGATMLFARQTPGGVFTFANFQDVAGILFFVDSNTGTNEAGAGRSPDSPAATLNYIISQNMVTANQGDVILLAPGHSETPSTATTMDIAGVRVVGLGEGALRAQFTINGNVDCIDITAANCTLENIYFNEGTNAHTARVNVAAANCTLRNLHFDCGTNDLESITVEAGGDGLVLDGITCLVTDDEPDALVELEAAGIDNTVIKNGNFICSDGTDAFDAACINSTVANSNLVVFDNTFSGDDAAANAVVAASATGLVVGPNSYGGLAVNADNHTEAASLGSADDTTTDSIHGKLGTDTELADRSLYDQLNGAGPAAAATAAVPANDVSIYGALRAVYNLVVPTIITGEADIDVSGPDYTAYENLVTIVPAAGSPLSDVRIVFDLDKTSSGWADTGTTETLQLAVARKVDGTNWVRHDDGATSAIVANNADGDSLELVIGDVGVTEEVRIEVILSAEAGDTELPFALSYKALSAPTVTAVAIP